MITVNIHEAKTNLSKLLAAVEEKGEVVKICRNGKEIAELKSSSGKSNSDIQTKKQRDLSKINPRLKVIFYEDPSLPTDPEGWPED